jgi:hypothetical protein
MFLWQNQAYTPETWMGCLVGSPEHAACSRDYHVVDGFGHMLFPSPSSPPHFMGYGKPVFFLPPNNANITQPFGIP